MAAAAGIIVGGIHYIHKYTLFLLELFAYSTTPLDIMQEK